jgi:sigma-B regulation protein RsbU (phosphoserine phosphatase)
VPQREPPDTVQLQTQITELKCLNEIAAAINACMSVEEITEIIIDRSLAYICAEQGAVFLISQQDDKAQKLKTYIRRTTKKPHEMPIHMNMNLTGWMIKYKKLLRINDAETENPLARLNLNSMGVRSLLAVPLITRNGFIGVLAVFNKHADAGFTDDDGRFLEILGSQCSQVIEAARLYEEEKRFATLREELKIARSIQQEFLPQEDSFGDGNMIYGFNKPAREVSGDFFDVFRLDDKRIFISVGDVVGKGIPAALLMSNVVAVERSHLSDGETLDLVALANNLNHLLCRFSKPGQFVTAFLGVYDLTKRTLEYINAGHHPPIIVNSGQLVPHNHIIEIVLGVIERTQYHASNLYLQPDSTVCIFTDGITETFNESGEEYGQRRLVSLIRNTYKEPAKSVCTKLWEDLNRFRGSAEQSDDMTAVIFKT